MIEHVGKSELLVNEVNTHSIISFTLGDEDDLKGLLDDFNSSYSAEVDCSFEYFDQIPMDEAKLSDFVFNQTKRKGIPQDIHDLSKDFTSHLFSEYLTKSNNNLCDKKKSLPKNQLSIKKKLTMESTNGFSNAGTKYTYFNLGSENSQENFGNKNAFPFKQDRHLPNEDFLLNENKLVPLEVGAASNKIIKQPSFLKINKPKFKLASDNYFHFSKNNSLYNTPKKKNINSSTGNTTDNNKDKSNLILPENLKYMYSISNKKEDTTKTKTLPLLVLDNHESQQNTNSNKYTFNKYQCSTRPSILPDLHYKTPEKTNDNKSNIFKHKSIGVSLQFGKCNGSLDNWLEDKSNNSNCIRVTRKIQKVKFFKSPAKPPFKHTQPYDSDY